MLPHAALQHLYKGFFGRIWEQTGKKLLQQAGKNRMRGSSALTRLTKQILKPQTTTSNKPQSKTRAKIEEPRPFTKHPLPRLHFSACVRGKTLAQTEPGHKVWAGCVHPQHAGFIVGSKIRRALNKLCAIYKNKAWDTVLCPDVLESLKLNGKMQMLQ